MRVDKISYGMKGSGTVEAINLFTIDKQDDSRETSYPVVAGDLHIFIGVYPGQHHFALILGDNLLHYRLQYQAGATPVGADIDQYRLLM